MLVLVTVKNKKLYKKNKQIINRMSLVIKFMIIGLVSLLNTLLFWLYLLDQAVYFFKKSFIVKKLLKLAKKKDCLMTSLLSNLYISKARTVKKIQDISYCVL